MRVKLGELGEIITGNTPKTSDANNYASNDIMFVKPSDISENTVTLLSKSEYDISEYARRKARILPVGSILVSCIGTVGKIAINTTECAFNQQINAIVPNTGKCYTKYVAYALQAIKPQLQAMANAAVVPILNKAQFSEIEIILPTIEEQRRIAAVLDKVTDLIAKRQAQLDKLDELVKSRFVEMFGDTVFNPMRWPSFPLAEMADIVSGITKGRKTKEQNLTEVPYMAVSNVKDGYIDWKTVKTISATQAEINQYRLLPDDVLMTEGGDPDKLGRGAIIQSPLENCIHQNHVFRVRLNETKILPMYFAEFLQHQKAKQYFLRCAKQTTGIASINMTQLKELPTLVPPIAVQQRFCEEVKQVTKVKATIQQDIDEFKKLKESLKQKYFGG